MIVAVAYNEGMINEHFGHAECFALYEYNETDLDSCQKRLINCADKHGHQAMADLMKENNVDAVIVGHMGDEARRILLSYGIVPVPGYAGPADMAADMLVSGQLPLVGEDAGMCSGGCGGCGGGCGSGEDAGGCGGGCGCH